MNETAADPGLQADERLVARGWLRIGIGMAVAGQAMVFGLAVNVTPADGVGYWVVHGGSMAAALGVLVFLGGDLGRGAMAALRQRKISIDLLFLVTLTGAFAGSLVSTFTRTGAIYYEVVAVLIAVHTVGKMIAARSRLTALSAVDRTRREFAQVRVRGREGESIQKTVTEVTTDDRVLVAPGEAIGVDGTIVDGRSYVTETSMTGEWRPVSRGPGDAVLAGTHAVDGDLEIAPLAGPRRLDTILSAVEQARLAPSQLQAQADRLMRWFLPVVMGVSVATFAFWIARSPWHEALFHAMAVLLVACPCAMGLATPIAVWSGLAQLAKLGMVAGTGDILDALSRADTLCIDKTGTLSESAMVVTAWHTAPAWRAREPWLRAAVLAAESDLQHPVAQALTRECNHNGYTRGAAAERRVEAGAGVVVTVEGREVRVGEWALHGFTDEVSADPGKRVYVSVDGRLAAWIELGERWREGMNEALTELAALGVAVEVLTGDAHPPAGLTVPVKSGLTPAEKTARVRELIAGGRTVVLVGDGVNDAGAMSIAAGSIAIRGGADLVRASAMATMLGDDLRVLPQAVRLSRAVRRGIHGNLRFAASYNAGGMMLAAAGWLHPVVAALLMVGSSLAVGVRSLRGVARAAATFKAPGR
ncbi:heavy metal translocating P-type ATPase [Synoicihabitans lomoniglobus]|uniref:Heavy metal translocating P-type ATPase n=1 Tax=Synoicihabitans lomoniglobus TaxID=2909285 RepID=A0AAF0CMC0_9BACT|nr:heavy metal translocating P-type ATPase [Opitutaceae bacterium LMO-M01]WED63081.1 heavy metal translocating P-type ATPase [Opitutaceae bacterium LMO-M01]